jgi:hypothetical protein
MRSGSFHGSVNGGVHLGTRSGKKLYLMIDQNADTPSFHPIFLPSS